MDLARELVVAALTAAGAVVDETPSAVEALLPASTAAELGLAEEVRIDCAGGGGADAIDGRLGAPLIDRLAARHLGAPPLAALGLPPELPRPLPAQLPILLNAVRAGEARQTREARRYLVATLRVTAHSDEVRSVLDTVAVRLDDGARVAAPPLERGEPRPLAPLAEGEQRHAARALQRWTAHEAPRRLAGAIEAVRRRLHRDLERMADFYASLDEEMRAAERRARHPEERARRAAKRAALPDDLAARRAQVVERVRPRLAAALIAATLVDSDVTAFAIPVRRRSRGGTVAVLGRAADSTFEGPACAACGIATLRLYLCDERLHVLCDACGHGGRLDPSRCPACQPTHPTPPVLAVDDPTEPLRRRLTAARMADGG
ncbi:MAG TPA: hypothetical protein VL049_15650 [Candidatus Dormibacteraeota bacterium]|nr:hypothetical protein [Candidatus Dormibacteraeota bacterium]